MQPTELRPRGIGEILDAAFKIYRSHFKLLVGLAAIAIVPVTVLQVVTAQPFLDNFSTILDDPSLADPSADPTEVLGPLFASMGALLGVGLLGFLAQTLVQAETVHAVSDTYAARSPVFKTSLSMGAKALPVLIATWLLAVIPLAVGFVLCLLPGVALATMWSMTTQTVVVEKQGPIASLRRSWQLVKPRFWPVLGTVLLAYLITSVAQAIPSGIGQVLLFPSALDTANTGALPESFNSYLLVSTIGSAIVGLFTYPYTASVYTILYYDLRIRGEAFDLQRMAAALDQPTPTSPTQDQFTPPSIPPPPTDPFGLPPPE